MDRQTTFAERCIRNASVPRSTKVKTHSVKCNLLHLDVNFKYISFCKERD